MEKRLFIAILVSFLVLLGWSRLAPVIFPELAHKEVAATPEPAKTAAPAATPSPAASNPASATTTAAEKPAAVAPLAPLPVESSHINVVIDRPAYRAVLSNQGAQLVSFLLKNYHEKDGRVLDLVKARPPQRHDFPFALLGSDRRWNEAVNSSLYAVDRSRKGGAEVVRFLGADPFGNRITKSFTFDDSYLFNFNVEVSNASLQYRVEVGPGLRTTDTKEKESQFTTTGNGVVQRGGKLDQFPREKTTGFKPLGAAVDFVGLDDNYFLGAIKPQRSGDATLRTVEFTPATKEEQGRRELYVGVNSLAGVVSGSAYFGPKETELLDRYGFESVNQFGRFGFIARYLLRALVYVNGFTRNYGWAIVLLTVIIKLLLYPLQHKSIVSMKKMQKVQPKVNAIKEKYRKAKTDPDQRQKMNVEMMKLYQQEGISPVSGCLPILLQLPILWAFYALLSHAIELRGAGWFGWINDLSAKDPYYITPLLMMITMFIQQWITPSTVDPMQKKMFMIMPLIFGFIFKEFPSGLVLYWLVQNVLTIAQQVIMNRYWKDHPEALKKA